MLADRRYCYPLTITDFASRYLLTCEALSTTQGAYAFAVFERAFKEFGLPRAIRTDNGVPFASRARALWPQQTVGLVAAARHSARAHPARAIPSRTAGTSACISRSSSKPPSRPRRTCCSNRRASMPSSSNTTASGRIRRSANKCRPPSTPRPRVPTAGCRRSTIPSTTGPRREPTAAASASAAARSISVRCLPGKRWACARSTTASGSSASCTTIGYFDDETCRLEPIENPFGPAVLPMSPE